jgi:dolichyl-phosphate mannosyltransferase polypeptide 2 regulatory subunit
MVHHWGTDRQLGLSLMILCTALFAYYTVWTIITPFIDQGHTLLMYFPNRAYAIMIPTTLGITALTVVTAVLAIVMIYN